MASPYGSPFGSAFGSPFSNPFSGSGVANDDEVFQKQMESMVNTLAKNNISVAPVDQSTWLEKLFKILNVPLGVTTSLASGFVKPGSNPGEGARQALDVITGKKTYGTTELLNDTLGKNDSFGRKVAAFALGIPMDPLTWIPLSKIAKPIMGAGAKGIRAVGGAEKLDQAADIASGVKKFFGYDDFARFGPKAEKTMQTMGPDGVMKTVVVQPAQADMRDVARQLQQLVGSGTARRGLHLEKYQSESSGLQKLLGTLSKDDKFLFTEFVEKGIPEGAKLSSKLDQAVESYKIFAKAMGDEKVKLGLIGDVAEGLPGRIGGETSEGYIKHVINPEFLRKYPTLSSVPTELQDAARPFYEIGSKGIFERKIPGTIAENNLKSQMATMKETGGKGIKMFEDEPEKIFRKEIEEMAQIRAQKDIIAKIKTLKDSSGQPLIQSFDDQTITKLAHQLSTKKILKGEQPFKAGTEMEDAIKSWMKEAGIDYGNTVKNVPNGMDILTNPLFQESGKVTAANSEIAKIINKLSDLAPGESTIPLVKKLDKITSAWKKIAITNPKFHINNLFGATTNNLIDDPMGTVKNAGLVSKILKGGDEKITLGKVTETADEIMKQFRESGAISGFTKAEAFTDIKQAKNLLKGIEKLSSKAGQSIETRARLTAYVNALERGLSPSEALQRVFQIHGNYAPEAMSKFEKDVIKRIIPFYTWAKTSMPYQAQSLWNKTGIYSNLAHSQGIIANEEDRKGIPDWLRSRVLLSTNKNKDGTSTARQLPLSVPDLEMFADPAKVLLSKLNPLIKIPLEVGQNRGTFFGETLFDQNKYSEEGKKVPMSSQVLDYITKQLPPVTAVKGAIKFADEELDSVNAPKNPLTYIMAAIAGQVDPTGPKSFDPAREKYAQQSVQAEMMRTLIGNLRRNGVIPPAK